MKIEDAGSRVTEAAADNIVAAYRDDGSVYIQVTLKDKTRVLELIMLVLAAVVRNNGRKDSRRIKKEKSGG